jgi:hypothetical protein
MDKKIEDGYYAGVGTGIFGIISLIIAWNTSFSTQMGQILGAVGSVFILLSIASFLKPESAGQIALRILKNQQNALMQSNSLQGKKQSNKISGDNNGNVLNIDSETANVTITNTPNQTKSKNDAEMTLLVAPLYSKSREKNRKRYFMKGAPGYINSALKTDKDFHEFWDKIEENQHLGVDYLRIALEKYQDNTVNEIGAKPDPEYEKAKNELIEKIEQRYHELLE